MTDNEKLINEARHAATYSDVRPISYRLVMRLADALEAAEKEHTPTDDERDALSTVIAKIREGFYPEGLSAVSNDNLAHAILAAGFRRSEASS